MTDEPSTLAELFAKDPLHYTEQDLSAVVEKMRASRHQFVAGDRSAGKVKKADPAKAKAAEDLLKGLGL